MTDEALKAAAKVRVAALVQKFRKNEVDYLSAAYNETQARTDFITPSSPHLAGTFIMLPVIP